MFTHNDKTSVFRLVGAVVFVIPAFDGDKRKKQNTNRTKRQAARSSNHKARNNLEEMDVERAEAKKRLEFTPTEDTEKKKQKQESADEDERRERRSTFKTVRPVMKNQNDPRAKAPTQKQKHARSHLPHKQCQR